MEPLLIKWLVLVCSHGLDIYGCTTLEQEKFVFGLRPGLTNFWAFRKNMDHTRHEKVDAPRLKCELFPNQIDNAALREQSCNEPIS